MTPPTNCLECNAPLTLAETQGLCARCLLKLGFASQLAGASSVPASPANSGAPPIMPFAFGPYRIERLLGKGGMGAVYEAEDTTSGRRVALKALGHSLDSPETRKRFLREGRLAASINHPNSVYVYGTEEIEGAPVITMELIPGGTLQERVKADGPMPVTAAVDAILQVIAGLEAAHAVGILHRDIKPSNCFIDPSGLVKVGDFGLSISTTSRGDSALTMAGSVLGTPEFSSPEQLRGEALDLRADIYSVGVTLYFLLTGRTPFHAPNVVQLLATVLDKPAPSPRTVRPEIPEELARIVVRCLAKPAGDRFKNYDELRRALLPFQSASPTPATLGLRFIAGVIDDFAISTFNMSLSFLVFGDFVDVSDPTTFRTPQWIGISIGAMLLQIAYYAVPEGLWGASLGKALMGLRVGDANRNAPGIARAAWRAVIYSASSLLTLMMAFIRFRSGGPLSPSTAWVVTITVAGFGYYALLVVTARRANGFATVIDLLTKTRVIQKSAYEARAAVAQIEEPVAATGSLPQIGPFHVLAPLATTTDGEFLLGYDTKLLRRVWIRKLPAGAPPVAAALRNAARPSRLRWLQGSRDGADSWDAYEAVPGSPFVNLLHGEGSASSPSSGSHSSSPDSPYVPQPWKNVRHWLVDLAEELETFEDGDSSSDIFSLDRVWITADGRAKLLDFSAPGAVQNTEPITDPAVFLNQLAISALEGRLASADEAGAREVRVPVPIPARGVLRDLRLSPDLAAFGARLQPLIRMVPEVSRRRRFGLVAGCVVPALLCGISMFAGTRAFQTWQRQYPDVMPLEEALGMRERFSHGKFPPGIDPKIGVEPVEIYIAGRFGKLIRDPKAWSSRLATSIILPSWRAQAERIVAAHPNPSPEEMEKARAALAPALNSRGDLSLASGVQPADHEVRVGDHGKITVNLGPTPGVDPADSLSPQLVFAAAGGIFVWAAFFSVVAAVLFRGGLLLRAFGIAVVRRDGADASRLRILWRACVAWSWIPLGMIVFTLLKPHTGWPAALAIVAAPIVALIAWSALRPGRSLQDLLAGSWLVPR